MNKEKLTEKQERVYLSIKKYIKDNKISPTVRELCAINGVSSTETIYDHLRKLRRKGYITFREKTPRSIVILD